MVSTHQLAALVEASLRAHPDMDLIVADNLRDRHYYLSGDTIYLNGALPATAAWAAIIAALDELRDGTTVRPGAEHDCAVIPFPRRHSRAG